MNKKNAALGVVLIFLGISMYLRNYNIGMGSLLMLFIGLGLLYGYYFRKEQPFIIFGSIFTAIGLMHVLKDFGLFRAYLTFETLLIVLGIAFIFIYFTKHIKGFIFPGTILPCVGVFLILENFLRSKYSDPSLFLLLGFAFYVIYFIEYMGKSSWPLIPATILMLVGILSYAFSFEIITWNIILSKKDYILPVLMIGAGVLILLNKIIRRR